MMIIIQIRAISISHILPSSIAGSPTAVLFLPETGFCVYTEHAEPPATRHTRTWRVFPIDMINRARFNNLVDFQGFDPRRLEGCRLPFLLLEDGN